ncbi:MAG: hypothetical protein WCX31_01270 [Salinivirgaceae bacterium]
MKAIAILFLMLLSDVLVGQKMFQSQSTICPLKFVMEDTLVLIKYEPNDSIMVADFLSGLEAKQLEKFKGVIMLQVMVDTIGRVCCVSYTNKSNLTDKKLDIPQRLQAMPGWKREVGIMESENICALVNLIFNENEIIVSRIGYNRNNGKKQLTYTVFSRKKEVAVQDSLLK